MSEQPARMKDFLRSSLVHFVTFYGLALVFGAPLTSVTGTTTFSLLLTLLCTVPLFLFCGPKFTHILDLLISRRINKEERSARVIITATLFGAWLGSIVIPLDWDRWWQVWPISNCIAMVAFSLFGWIFNLTVMRRYPTLLQDIKI